MLFRSLTAIPGRVGTTATVLTRDAYGHGPVERTITEETTLDLMDLPEGAF